MGKVRIYEKGFDRCWVLLGGFLESDGLWELIFLSWLSNCNDFDGLVCET
jgi:hypothetical protein